MDKEELINFETAIAYAQVAVHTLKNSATEINTKTLKSEMKMLLNKFGTDEVIKMANNLAKRNK